MNSLSDLLSFFYVLIFNFSLRVGVYPCLLKLGHPYEKLCNLKWRKTKKELRLIYIRKNCVSISKTPNELGEETMYVLLYPKSPKLLTTEDKLSTLRQAYRENVYFRV